ncbi:MAG TPA: hypothetical protein VHE55_05875 [Fimbriimonadaceae bacterium]|nr:hypothetical protein [Fimbriimonadaceae bacterium]
MNREIGDDHPLKAFLSDALGESLNHRLGLNEDDEVQSYLVRMLIRFLHRDAIYDIRNAQGLRVESVAEMVSEGDIRLNADSFDREREVHKHIGDFLLFWSGVFPEFLQYLKAPTSPDAVLDVVEQGRFSYHVASTFEHPPYEQEAGTFKKLSARFVEYQHGLRLVRSSFEGFAQQTDWLDGFRA